MLILNEAAEKNLMGWEVSIGMMIPLIEDHLFWTLSAEGNRSSISLDWGPDQALSARSGKSIRCWSFMTNFPYALSRRPLSYREHWALSSCPRVFSIRAVGLSSWALSGSFHVIELLLFPATGLLYWVSSVSPPRAVGLLSWASEDILMLSGLVLPRHNTLISRLKTLGFSCSEPLLFRAAGLFGSSYFQASSISSIWTPSVFLIETPSR